MFIWQEYPEFFRGRLRVMLQLRSECLRTPDMLSAAMNARSWHGCHPRAQSQGHIPQDAVYPRAKQAHGPASHVRKRALVRDGCGNNTCSSDASVVA